MESKIKLETEKTSLTSKPERIVDFKVINNTDQHLFLTEEKFVLKAVEWDVAALEKFGKPVIIEKMGGTNCFSLIINRSMKTNSFLTWTGGCDLSTFVLNFINEDGMNVRISDKRYEAKIESLPIIAFVGAHAQIKITLDMVKKG